MDRTVNFSALSINKTLKAQPPLSGRSKSNVLFLWCLISVAAAVGLIVSIYFEHTILSLITLFTVLFCFSVYFKYIFFRPVWRQIAHAMLIMATLVNFNDAYLASQNVNIITVQLIMLAIVFSFTMLGREWGLFYSFLNLVPTLVFLVLEYNNNYFIALSSGQVDLSSLVISLCVDVVLIILILSNFFIPFFRKIKKPKKISEDEMDISSLLALAHENDEVSSHLTSTFTNTFELKNNQQLLGQSDKKLRLLIAEDNPLNVKIMEKLFAKLNITPTIAENGEQALEFLKYNHFDLILMDLQMPVLDGFGAAKGIRALADPKKAGIPIIAVTAAAFQNIREKVLNAGMNDYLSKPFDPTELMEKIHRQLAVA
jgi:CheY-like chemotaxis protein